MNRLRGGGRREGWGGSGGDMAKGGKRGGRARTYTSASSTGSGEGEGKGEEKEGGLGRGKWEGELGRTPL